MDEALSPDALPSLPDLSPVGQPVAVPPAPPLPTPPGGMDAHSRLMTLAMLASAIGVGKHNGGAGLLGGFLDTTHQQEQDKQKKYEFDVQEQQRQAQIAQRAQQAEAERQARAVQQRNTALSSISKIVPTLQSKDQYDSFIDMAGNQLMLAGYRDLSPNALRVNFRYVAPSSQKLASQKLDEILKSPLTQTALKASPDKVVNGVINFDANGDGIPEQVTIQELAKIAGRPIVMDGMTGQPILPDKKDGNPGTAFQELLKSSREQFMAENKRPPKPEEDKKLISDAILKSKEKPDVETTPINPDDVNATAQAILAKRMAPSQLSLVGGMGQAGVKFKQAVMGAVLRQQPDFNFQEAESGYQFGKNTGVQTTVRMIDNIERSLPILEKASDDFKRSGVRIINKATLAGKSQFGDTAVVTFETARLGLADEIAKILSGGGTGSTTSDSKLKQANDLLASDMTPGQLRAVIKEVRTLLQTRRGSLTSGTYMDKGGASTPDAGGGEVWVRDANGKLVKQ